ncbi:SusC/RagA family TonB-linked outer membrane protein [Zobellia sp. 1_MG-2023]|uniref:SusC/RagA family TonB-linked outer membrane protein n=1 Tax=Zobellia sp. 1_MG-2023 TaxID=3062626 RepID=UPI0026E2A065|nr:SusC/RagA family TonB-linked outer membrane protein [Zobellia sp. 1_MG-2023]MDO6818008.1 SusC/RagA family TonB-linked outer membrane protein [Zobellia sp. 1_MG-2023]
MKRTVLLALFTLVVSLAARAQTTFTGTVLDENQVPLPGASLVIKGSATGVATDFDGNFSIELPEGNEILVVSYLGYIPSELNTTGKTTATIVLQPNSEQLGEVVVTALGIKREAKKLAYAVQKVSGEDISKAKETNVVNSLAGKLAGVQVTGGNSGVGSSSQIIIRGESSLNPSPNANSPLFVVDGIPINNSVSSRSSEGNMEVDYGNGAQDINPDDIETMNVLKGPSATALYGSRGANGVILITTKSGKNNKGIGVSYTNNTTFESILTFPEYQYEYGQGSNGQFAFADGGQNRSITGGVNDHVDESWGPALNGQLIAQHDSPTTSGLRAGDVHVRPRNADGTFADEIIATPFLSRPGNIKSFFETGHTISNNIALTGGNDKGNFRLSFTDLQSEGIVPNTDYNRRSYALNGSYQLADWLKVSGSMNYVNSNSGNRPVNSYGTENIMYLWIWFGQHVDMDSLRDYWQPGLEGVQQYNYNYNYHDNPFFNVYENTNSLDKDRIITNMRADIKLAKGLDFMFRTGFDYANELNMRKRAYSTQRFPKGQYREDNIYAFEQNTDFLLGYNTTFNDDFDFGLSFGGNSRIVKNRYQRVSANSLSIPGIYNFGNAAEPLTSSDYDDKKEINSLYAFANFGFKDYLFLDVTGRNDWSSTLPLENSSYFYPSAGLSLILSDMFTLPKTITFAKLRAGWASVGNDTDPYNLLSTYGFGTTFNGFSRVNSPSELKLPDLKPERTNSFEVGADLRLLNNRLGLDVALYRSETKNQIISLPVSNTSGYNQTVINAGKVRNEGLEITLNATPVKSENFTWNTNINFTTNRGEILELAEELPFYRIKENYLIVGAEVGKRMGDLYGTGFVEVTDPNSPHFGKWIINQDTGLPSRDNELRNLGNYNPDFMVGLQNSFRYKNLNLGVLFDWRQGGVYHSRTVSIGGTTGLLDFTTEGRETGIVAEGVINTGTKENPVYEENTINVPASGYYSTVYNRSNEETTMYDASYVKLREVKFGYNFPKKMFSQTPIASASISLVGRNLALWTENPHVDPETLSFSGGSVVPGVEDMALPSTRSYGFNINIEF